ncbi:hypothetical protein Dred_1431 [Desulforamulus reducens MI-1]|uniref:Uncharacterized protein n=1 Tax=Desulforamulus reducens (strain ATCC BAA-1160 / DSM 100696 / MI-1) TaxID=349161 RepID=A4J4F8_DESRM|nr:hypothetical protein [Desulforamulus reducens]ABO49961.1 hypothetical protein Dred_1431 [Desulforamulus reducens MI-1]
MKGIAFKLLVGSMILALVGLVFSIVITKLYVEKGIVKLEPVVKQESMVSNLRVDSGVASQDQNWFRVSSTIKNTSKTPVSVIDVQLSINGGGNIFDQRYVTLSQVIEPGKSITFDNTFDYPYEKEIPQDLEVSANIVNVKVPSKVTYTMDPVVFN